MTLAEYIDSLGMSAEDTTSLATILAKADKTKASAPLMLQSDYTRKTQELAAEKTRLAGEQAEMGRKLSKVISDLEANKITNAQYRAKIEALTTEYGDDFEGLGDLLKNPTASPDPTKVTPPVVDQTILDRLARAESNFHTNPEIAAILADARDQYVELYGSVKAGPGFSAQKLLAYARENKIPLLQGRDENGQPITGPGAFERLFKVDDRRTELLRETIRAEEKTRADGELQKRIDNLKIGERTGERPGFVQAGSSVLSDRFKSVVADRTSEKGEEGKPAVHQQPRSEAEKIRSGGAAKFEKSFMERRLAGIPLGGKEKAA